MDYHEAANFLFDLRRFSMDPGVESTRALLSHLGDPQESVDVVQVAGSNGKGSTARMVESVLREAGCRVGLYTSPHLETLRERVRVDGRMVPESAVTEFVEAARPYVVDRAAGDDPLTFFEVVTAMGLWHFDRADVDVAVLEVGLGGEHDATSAVSPAAAAVTNVTLEHTAVLGDTIAEIARTKARIAPADAPLVTAATGEALAVIREEAGEVVTVGERPAADPSDGDGNGDEDGDGDGSGAAATAAGVAAAPDVRVHYGGRVSRGEAAVSIAGPGFDVETRLPLLGAYQARNAGVASVLARQVAAAAGVDVDGATLARGLRNAHWPGRFEVVDRDPLLVLDGAHNPGACAEVADTLGEFGYDDLHLVFGAMHDKDHGGMAAALPDAASVTTCRPDIDRAEDPAVLAAAFRDRGVDVHTGDSVAAALERARELAGPRDCVLVVGSLYCVAEARTAVTRLQVPATVRDEADARRVLERAHVAAGDVEPAVRDARHHVVRAAVQRRQAETLRAEMLAVGGDCAVSGLRSDGELRDVVLMGTRAQFAALVDALDDAPYGLSAFGDDLRRRVDGGRASTGRPWADDTAVMGILNVTPDSFYDGGEYVDPDDAIERAAAMVDAGADIVDVGGESTRPGADPVPVDEEIRRVRPVIEAVADLDVAVSVDTRKADVAEAALDAGADVINDVTGLADPEMRWLAADRGVPVVVMHSVDAPVVPGKEVPYDDVVDDVLAELRERVFLAEKAGIPREDVVIDPGLGFGKRAAESFELLDRLDEFAALGCPVLVGHSRKSMFDLVDRSGDGRLAATVAATALAVDRGADVVRVHDVPENVAAVRTALAARDPGRFDD
jgi:dihydropteroate synthase